MTPRRGATMLRVICNGCGRNVNAPEKLAGRRVACPGCGTEIRIPASQPPPPILAHSGSIPDDPAPTAPVGPFAHNEEPARPRPESGQHRSTNKSRSLQQSVKKYHALRIIGGIYRVLGGVV